MKKFTTNSLHYVRTGRRTAIPMLLHLPRPQSFRERNLQEVMAILKEVLPVHLVPDPTSGALFPNPSTLTNQKPYIRKSDEMKYVIYFLEVAHGLHLLAPYSNKHPTEPIPLVMNNEGADDSDDGPLETNLDDDVLLSDMNDSIIKIDDNDNDDNDVIMIDVDADDDDNNNEAYEQHHAAPDDISEHPIESMDSMDISVQQTSNPNVSNMPDGDYIRGKFLSERIGGSEPKPPSSIEDEVQPPKDLKRLFSKLENSGESFERLITSERPTSLSSVCRNSPNWEQYHSFQISQSVLLVVEQMELEGDYIPPRELVASRSSNILSHYFTAQQPPAKSKSLKALSDKTRKTIDLSGKEKHIAVETKDSTERSNSKRKVESLEEDIDDDDEKAGADL